ncbi:MAG TPA: hypothetical protein VH000_10765 [Rhizomicrobium sp.]|jgi:hypothetical protein|nr:hypothetical protein [Rhizomicrobium sp.]
MTQTPSPLPIGQVVEAVFEDFSVRITIRSERELTVDMIAGSNTGFSDTIAYEAVTIRDGLIVLSWQEHIGSTIVHVLDLDSCSTYLVVTPAKGGFMRRKGRIDIKSSA